MKNGMKTMIIDYPQLDSHFNEVNLKLKKHTSNSDR